MTSSETDRETLPIGSSAERARQAGRATPPVPVDYFIPWMYFLLVLSLLVAWLVPARMLLDRWVWQPVDPGERSEHSFVALAYKGISDKPDEVNLVRFREHLAALRRAGYVPVTLRDVEALYRDGSPLPRKAVLLTFEHGRRSSYFAVKRLLRRSGWNAVMFLWTRPILERDPAVLRWPYIRNMARARTWELGLQSHDGFTRIPRGGGAHTGNFMTTPRWLDREGRFESVLEFQERLQADHATARALMERHVGLVPNAYAYPMGDFGQYRAEAVVIPAVNLALAEKYYDLVFLAGNLALNTRHSDPRRLNRLLVRPEWSGQDLVARLDRSWPVMEPVGMHAATAAGAAPWIVDWGKMEIDEDGGLRLLASPESTGGTLWLAGSDLRSDVQVRVRFTLEDGQLGVFLRATPDGQEFVYLGIDAHGEALLEDVVPDPGPHAAPPAGVWLRQKHIHSERFTVASGPSYALPGRTHELDLYLRENLLFALLDGEPLFRDRIQLRGRQHPGMLGLSVWDAEAGRARVHLHDVALRAQPPAVAAWDVVPRYEPHVFQWIHKHAYRFTGLSPAWITASGTGPLMRTVLEMDTYKLLARVNRLGIFPRLVIEEERGLERISPVLLARETQTLGADGLLVDLTLLQNPSLPKLAAWVRRCGDNLAERGLDLLLQVPQAMESSAGLQTILAVIPRGGLVVGMGSPPQRDGALSSRPTVTREDIPPPSGDEIPAFYMIPGLPGTATAETAESRLIRLFQEGMAAFQDQKYADAVAFWKEWLELEPENPRAWMLLGDAEIRRGRLVQALEYYDGSLRLDPGQTGLALRRVRLLEDMDRADEARAALNLYARLFPEDPEIMMGQSDWLFRQGRAGEALEMARAVTERNPGHIDALALLFRLSDDRVERQSALERIVQASHDPNQRPALVRAIQRHDLLMLPQTRPLMNRVRELARDTTQPPAVTQAFRRLQPRLDPVAESFSDSEALSARWRVDGGSSAAAPRGLRLKAGPSYTEIGLRLQDSPHAPYAFISATLRPEQGNGWLMARRTRDYLVRFGYVEDRLHLQTWRQGRIVSAQETDWARPGGPVTLVLDVSGKGAMGYIDHQPVFPVRTLVPDTIGRGWLGLAVHDHERGRAALVLQNLAAGPSPPVLAIPEYTASEAVIDRQMERLRPLVNGLSALCPDWYRIGGDGSWIQRPQEEQAVWRLFANYHRLWLLPVVRVDQAADLNPDTLASQIAATGAEGWLILAGEQPGPEILSAWRARLNAYDVPVVVGVKDRQTGKLHLSGIAAGEDLLGSEEPLQAPLYTLETFAPRPPQERRAAVLSIPARP